MDGEHSIPKEGKNPADVRAAGQFLGNLIGMLKAINLYPSGHQMLLQTKDKFFTFLQCTLYETDRVAVRIFKNDLFCMDLKLPPEKTVGLADFIEELQKRYIRQIIFTSSITREEMDIFIDIFRLDPYDLESKGGMEKLLNKHGVSGIKILEYYSRKIITLDQQKLLELTNSPIFHFLIEDTNASLEHEDALRLYDLLKDANLICALIRVAAQFILKKNPEEKSAPKTILQVLTRIKEGVLASGLSEEEEMKEILKGTVTAFDPETVFNLVFEAPDDPIIKFTGAAAHLAANLDQKKTAGLITAKLSSASSPQHLIAHTKKVLQRLFTDRQTFLRFLPAFKESLQENIPKPDIANTILNDVCSAFAPEFSIEDDVELALGEITDAEKQGIVEGLETLKSVRLKRKSLEKMITDFDINDAYMKILKALFLEEEKASLMQNFLEKLVDLLKGYLQQENVEQSSSLIAFFAEQAGPESKMREEFRGKIAEALHSLPDFLLEKFFSELIKSQNDEFIQKQLSVLLVIFREKLIGILTKIYLSRDDLEQTTQVILRNLIAANYSSGMIRPDPSLYQQASGRAMRMLDLLVKVPSSATLPIFWEMTFHQNSLIAQRALSSIPANSAEKALPFLLKATAHANTTLCLISVEALAKYNNTEVVNILAAIALGEKDGDDEERNLKIRIAALKSLFQLNKAKGAEVKEEILSRKKFFFFPTEPKEIRDFLKTELK